MNSKEIDDVIDAITSEDFEKILMYADIEIKDNRTAKEFLFDEGKNIAFQKIMSKIENGDYEYFISLKDSLKATNVDVIAILMQFSSKKDDIKELVEENRKFNFRDIELINLIKATNDPEYIKEFIENKSRREEIDLFLWPDQIIDLIIATKDVEYIKSYIEDFEKRIYMNLMIEEDELISLIKGTGDSDYIKNLIQNSDRRKEVGLFFCSITDFVQLIISTKDIDYIKSFIENKKIKYKFASEDFEDVMDEKDESKYKNSIIGDMKKREEYQLLYGSLFDLIEATHDEEYIKEYIEDKNKRSNIDVEFDSYRTILLLKHLGDSEYIKSFINDKKKRNKAGIFITSENAVELIILTHDTDFIKSCIENEDKREELGLDEKLENYLRLIVATNDAEYIESYLEDEKKREKLGLVISKRYIVKMIMATDDPEYLKSFIESEEKREKFGLQIDDIFYCLEEFSTKKVNEIIKPILEKADFQKESKNRKVNLPENMTIGIEIESEGRHYKLIHRLNSIMDKGWRYMGDSSLDEDGLEVTSPILMGKNGKTEETIRKTCGILNVLGQKANSNCAAHVHIGADYLTSEQSWINFKEIWGNCEEILYIISNKEGEIPREGILEYAEPISGRIENELSKGTVQLNNIDDVRKFAKKVQKENRYFSVNFDNIGKSKNTIEFRLANGTLDADTWIENINLFGGLIQSAEELYKIQERPKEEQTEKDKRKLEFFEKIKDSKISKQEKLEAFLEMVIPKEDRDIYRKRYQVNNDLLEENVRMKKIIKGKIAKNPIDLRKILKKKLFGESPVTGQDYEENEVIIQRDLQRENLSTEKCRRI